MPLARGTLYVTTGGTLTLPTGDVFVSINGTNVPALASTTDQLATVDSPLAGQLRYLGAGTTVSVTAELSTQTLSEVANFEYRISKNGTPLVESHQTRTQSEFVGYVGVSLAVLVDVGAGDLIEVSVASNAANDLDVLSMTLSVEQLIAEAEDVIPPPLTPSGTGPWPTLENLLNVAIVTSRLGQPVEYTAAPASAITVRGVFDLDGYEPDLSTGTHAVRISTGAPSFTVRDADIGREALVGDLVTVNGLTYMVKKVVLSGQVGFSRCHLAATS